MGFNNSKKQEMSGRKIIYLDDAIDALNSKRVSEDNYNGRMWRGYRNENIEMAIEIIQSLPSAQPEIIRCKNCEHWRQQTNYQGTPLPFGFCESDDMWRSLYGETYEVSHIGTDEDFYCGYAERRTYD